MALGDKYQSNNNNNKNYSPTVYSGYKFNNAESKVDATTLAPSFWNSMLKIMIAPRKETNNGDVSFDFEQGVAMYLTHTKARLLYLEIEEFQKNPEAYKNVGVDSGNGLISLSNGAEFGVNGQFIIIRKINAESGELEASIAYDFKQDYHYSIRNFDEKTSDFDKIYHNDLELEQFKTLLRTYYEAMTGALAYSMIDNMKYDNSRINTKVDLLMDKLGIEKKSGHYNNSNKSSNSLFSNREGKNTSFQNSSMDDIMDEIG